MLYVRFGVLIVFAGRLFTTDAQLVNRESSIPVAAHLGGDVTFDINGAVHSRCQTHVGQMVVCLHGTTMEGIGPEFQNRISGTCDHIKLKDVRKGDLDHRFICENLDPLKPATYTYKIKDSYITVATHLGGDVTFDINGAVASQCRTTSGVQVVECHDGTTVEGIGLEFQNRFSGSCDRLILKDVRKGDLDLMFICEYLDPPSPATYTYSIKAITAPPQNVSLSVDGSKVSVSWQPPPADWQTGAILEYEVKWSCNATELLRKRTTSTVLEGLPQGVRCTVSVAAVTSDGVEAWSEPKSVEDDASGSSKNTGTDTPPVEEGKPLSHLVGSLVGGLLVFLVLLALLVFLMKRHWNSVSGFLLRPQPNAEQRQNCSSPVDTTELHHLRDVEENPTQTQTTAHMLSGSASPRS